jgi:PAS domain S-box-containing protein
MANGMNVPVQRLSEPMTDADSKSPNAMLGDRVRFETLVSDLSAQFIKLPPEKVDRAIEQALERVREFFSCERCGLLALSADRKSVFITHISYAEGVEPISKDINLADIWPSVYRRIVLQGIPNFMASLRDLPPEEETDRQTYIAAGVRSALAIPLFVAEGVRYIIAIQALLEERDWPEEYLPRLRLLGELCVSALERRDADEALRESEARFKLSMDATRDGLWDWNIETDDGYFSPGYYRMLGYEVGDFPEKGLTWQGLLHPDDRERTLQANRDCIEGRCESFKTEFRMKAKSGEWRWILGRGKCVARDARGRAVRMVGTHVDITERKNAESQAQRHFQELAHLSRVATVGELTASLAHELNQPLGAILRNTEAAELILRDDVPDLEELRAIITDIHKDDERAGKVIDRLRMLLKRHAIAPAPLALGLLVEDVVSLLRSNAADRHVRLESEMPPGLPPVCADRVQLQQVLLNLIMNAMDAVAQAPGGGRRVVVRARPVGDGMVEAAVSDSGTGIPPENLGRLFEPFFTTKASGMGMGLAISRTIIEAHGGSIRAENNAAGGATFRFTLKTAAAGGAE